MPVIVILQLNALVFKKRGSQTDGPVAWWCHFQQIARHTVNESAGSSSTDTFTCISSWLPALREDPQNPRDLAAVNIRFDRFQLSYTSPCHTSGRIAIDKMGLGDR